MDFPRFWIFLENNFFKAYYRSSGFSIYTYIPRDFYPLTSPKHLIYHHNPMTGCPNPIMNITVNNITQGIAFLNTRRQGYTSNCLNDDLMHTGIEICEIRIMGRWTNASSSKRQVLILRLIEFSIFSMSV